MKKRFLLTLTGICLLMHMAFTQPYTLQVRISSQPYSSVAVGYMQGDQFRLCDSLITTNILHDGQPSKLVTWSFPAGSQPGVYRIVFGYTTYARVMDEPPQQLDFIFNGEDVRFQTYFKAPADSLKVISSEENKLWFSFLDKEKEYVKKLKELEMEVNYYQDKLTGSATDLQKNQIQELQEKVAGVANRYNLLQMERESFIVNLAAEYPHFLATRIIKAYREPFRDGYLSAPERKASWQKEYFRFIDFSDETLIHTSVLTDKIFNYLVTYNQPEFTKAQREEAYIGAVDEVMAAVEDSAGKEAAVYNFVLDYMTEGFERLGMNVVLDWISDNYAR